MKFWYRVCFVLVRVGLFFWHPVLRVQGLENLTKGAAVLCGNHSSAADPLWIILALRQPELFRIMAKSELRRTPFIGWVMEKFRVIFVHRGEHDTQAVEECVRALKSGEKLLLFPEGTRCNGNKHVRAKTGAVRMAAAAGVPITPIFVTRNKTPLCPIDVIVGKPIRVDCAADASRERLQLEADELLRTIYSLGGDSYADHIGENSGLLLRS